MRTARSIGTAVVGGLCVAGAQGPRGMTWRGERDAASLDDMDDAVAFGGSSSIALQVEAPDDNSVVVYNVGRQLLHLRLDISH